jgi:two-component system, NarL family, sensor histidine kinase UhpB
LEGTRPVIRGELPASQGDRETLRRKSEILEAIFDNFPVMISFWDAAGSLLLVNRHWEQVLGWRLEEAQRIDYLAAAYPDPESRRRVLELIRGGDHGWADFKTRRRDGRTVDTSWTSVTLSDGTRIGVGQEITERKQAEKELRRALEDRRRAEERLQQSYDEMRALSARLRAVREDESTRIARAVHDEVGQLLTALRLEVAWLERTLQPAAPAAGEEVPEKLRSMIHLLDAASDAVHRVASELRPVVLDKLGLDAAVEWYVGEFEKRSRIGCRLCSSLGGVTLDGDRSIALFRILQEALTNVARHSGATEVSIRLTAERGRVLLAVTDNGGGIPDDKAADSGSLGLLGMRERARSLGGDVGVRRNPGGGTTVEVTLPNGRRRSRSASISPSGHAQL